MVFFLINLYYFIQLSLIFHIHLFMSLIFMIYQYLVNHLIRVGIYKSFINHFESKEVVISSVILANLFF